MSESPSSARRVAVFAGVVFAVFCFFMGVLLMIFPWLDRWELNYFATFSPTVQTVWMNSYFRGLVSGLGLINIFVSFVEIVSLRRFFD